MPVQQHILVFSVIFAGLLFIGSCAENANTSNICTSQRTCGACIGKSPKCRWCQAPNYRNEDRCDFHENLLGNCSEKHILSPSSELTPIKNEIPRNAILNQDPVQLSPQEIKIKLRPNEPFQFPVVFRQAENYPVDLYFLMDVSHTMKQYKETLAKFSHILVNEISNITTDYRFGFGSFVDKTTLPYISTAQDHDVSPCNGCSKPYGFRNQLSLTANETAFKHRITGLEISGNLDAPEGGFDAIMQAVVCTNNIGWRNHSRKLILFSTDGSFHYAGDGKLGGIVLPNDGHCHIDSDGFYSETLNQDYPSISQLSHKISEQKVNVIFVVPGRGVSLYSSLSAHILGSNVGELASDSSNVIDLVKENYNRIQSEIELKTENLADVAISFHVRCPDGNTTTVPKCDKLKIGEMVTFNVTIQVDSCPSDTSQWNKSFQIYPVGLTEKLTVHLELICECPCELPAAEEPNSEKCSSSGTYECGICTCNRGFYGKKCECGGGSTEDGGQDDFSCRMSNTSQVCQGRGHCKCGQCICDPIHTTDPSKSYSGTFCQCNDYSCDHFQGELCGGLSRGKCICGKCHCLPEYNGTRCECPVSTEKCKASNGEICNGKGKCICGSCECADSSFKMPTCEDCPTCPGKCEQNRPCVQCAFPNQEKSCSVNCSQATLIDSIAGYAKNDEWKVCDFRDGDFCVYFVYSYKNNDVKVQRSRECAAAAARVSDFVIIIIVVCAVLAIGIFSLLIWKILITFHDHREYKAFVEEQGKADWPLTVNPLFKKATTNFQNPTYKPTSS